MGIVVLSQPTLKNARNRQVRVVGRDMTPLQIRVRVRLSILVRKPGHVVMTYKTRSNLMMSITYLNRKVIQQHAPYTVTARTGTNNPGSPRTCSIGSILFMNSNVPWPAWPPCAVLVNSKGTIMFWSRFVVQAKLIQVSPRGST